MYTKRDGVAAYHIVWIGLCLRSVPGVLVLASAVDDGRLVVHSTSNNSDFGTSNNSDFGKDITTP